MDENATADSPFARLVSLACHDLRTPLATVVGFAHTLRRQGGLEEPAGRYVEMIAAAAEQLGELVDELSLGARIESGRYDPVLREVDSLELARNAAERLGEERVVVEGTGAAVELDADASERAVAALAQCALRHGGLEQVRLERARRRADVGARHARIRAGSPRRGPAGPGSGHRGSRDSRPGRRGRARRRGAAREAAGVLGRKSHCGCRGSLELCRRKCAGSHSF